MQVQCDGDSACPVGRAQCLSGGDGGVMVSLIHLLLQVASRAGGTGVEVQDHQIQAM